MMKKRYILMMFERFFKQPKNTHNQTILVGLIQNNCEFLFGYSMVGYIKGEDSRSFSMLLYLFLSTLANFTVISFDKYPYLERSSRYIFLTVNGAFWPTQYKNISVFMFWIFFEYRLDIPISEEWSYKLFNGISIRSTFTKC